MITTVTGKHQITIPAQLIKALDIQPGTRIDWSIGEDGVLLARLLPHRSALARKVAGMGRHWVKPGTDPVADLIRERDQDDRDVDSLIAATAAVHQLTLVHRDPHLAAIPAHLLQQRQLPDKRS